VFFEGGKKAEIKNLIFYKVGLPPCLLAKVTEVINLLFSNDLFIFHYLKKNVFN